MVKWTEVDAYSGMPVKEDAPTNFAGAGSKVAMPPDAMMKKKKKKTFLDARTKEYKEHQKRLEAARQRREERRDNIGLVLSCSHALMPSCSHALVAATWIVAAAF